MIDTFKKIPIAKEKPHLIIANTIKGKGVSFIENDAKWHHKVPNKEQLEKAMKELDSQLNKGVNI